MFPQVAVLHTCDILLVILDAGIDQARKSRNHTETPRTGRSRVGGDREGDERKRESCNVGASITREEIKERANGDSRVI